MLGFQSSAHRSAGCQGQVLHTHPRVTFSPRGQTAAAGHSVAAFSNTGDA
jgi:hypothetical protein